MTIVCCLPGRSYSGEFLKNWTSFLDYSYKRKFNILLSQKYSSNVYFVRAMCVGGDVIRGEHQKPWDGKISYDYILWIDSDILFTPDNFERLLSHNVDICSGLYLMEGGENFATVEYWDEEFFNRNGYFEFLSYNSIKDRKDSLIEVSYSGMGFMLVKRGVFENITYPWFFDEIQRIGNCVDIPSEDVSFCKKAIKAGYKIYIDPNVIVGHQKTITLR